MRIKPRSLRTQGQCQRSLITHRRRGRAFTLIELLVVISITMILIGLLLPAIGRARDHARTTACATQLHQAMIAMAAYAADFRQELFWRDDYDGDGVFDINKHGMDWFAWGGRETGNVVVPPQDDLFNRLVPRPLNRYTADEEVYICPSDSVPWGDAYAQHRSLHEAYGNSYLFNSNGPPWDRGLQSATARQAVRGLGGKRLDEVLEPSRTVVFADAEGVVYLWRRLWHHGQNNTAFADGHVAALESEALADVEEVTWNAK